MAEMKPRPSVYCADFIAANQVERADNLIPGTKAVQVNQIRTDITDFRSSAFTYCLCHFILDLGVGVWC